MGELVVIQHLEREGPGRFAAAAGRRGWSLRICRPDRGEPLPDAGEAGQALLVLGGPMGVADLATGEHPWLAAEVELIRQRAQNGRPVLGICLGAQLLAHALGGNAVPLQVGEPPQNLREVGWGAVSWTAAAAEEPVLRGLGASSVMLHWHGDRIVLPPGATLLASTLHCREQMFRWGRHAWGLQFHPEVESTALERWLQEDRTYVVEALGDEGPERIRREASLWQPAVELEAGRLIEQLLEALEAAL
ncbi:MAG: type 1 glutamine amidotransferase [Prochlorococcaceae cyanobacterium]|jgi:GMP synthase (glutamine-hydrolysing)